MSRELFAGNAGDYPRRTRIGGYEIISIDSHLLKVEGTSLTRYEKSFQFCVCTDSDGRTLGINTARCSKMNLLAAAALSL